MKKIRKQWNKSTDQTIEIDRQQSVNQSNIDNLSKANLLNQYIKTVRNLSSEWITLNHETDERFFPSERVFYQTLSYEWVIEIDFLPEYLIPYIDVQILYKSPENIAERAVDDDDILFKTSYVIQSEDTTGNDYPKITLVGHIFVRQTIGLGDPTDLDVEDIEAKILITLQNPNNYV